MASQNQQNSRHALTESAMRYAIYAALAIVIAAAGTFSLAFFLQSGVVVIYTEPPTNNMAEVLGAITEKESAEKDEDTSVKIIFTGDIMMDRAVRSQINQSGEEFRYPFLKIADFLSEADIVVGNMEGPISERGLNVGGPYSFRHDPRVIEGLKFANFGVLSLANNHIWDWGAEALEDTVTLLEDANITPVGAGRNEKEANTFRVMKIGGNKIVFLSHTNLYPGGLYARKEHPGISNPEIEKVKTAIEQAKEEADVVVSLWHWGVEYETRSHPREQALARELIDAGADLVVGHHPHVVQEIEKYNNGYIAYSLGNFVFDQYFSEKTMSGIMLETLIKNGEIVSVRSVPHKITRSYQPYIPE